MHMFTQISEFTEQQFSDRKTVQQPSEIITAIREPISLSSGEL